MGLVRCPNAKIRALVAAIAVAGAFVLTPTARSEEYPASCAVVSGWRQLVSNPPASGSPIAAFADYQKKVRLSLIQSARSIYDLYFQHRWSQEDSLALGSCMYEDGKDRLNHELQSVFWQSSLERLRSAGGGMARLASLVHSSSFQMFRLVGHLKESDDDNGQGGFHRGRRSIFMDFTQIAPNDWLLIFVHELTHEVDTVLRDAVTVFNDVRINSRVSSLARANSDPASLGQSDRLELDRWLTSGLDRGLLAEVRAWSISFALYLEGRANGVFQPIGWLDSILANRQTGENLASFALRYLDPRFVDPSDPLFNQPLLIKELADLRSSIRNGTVPVRFGPELLRISPMIPSSK